MVLVRSTKNRATYVEDIEIIFDKDGFAWVEESVANALFRRKGGGYVDAKKAVDPSLGDLTPLELFSTAYQQILQDPDKTMLLALRGRIREMVAEVDMTVDAHQRMVGSGAIPDGRIPTQPAQPSIPSMPPMVEEPVVLENINSNVPVVSDDVNGSKVRVGKSTKTGKLKKKHKKLKKKHEQFV